MKIFLRSILILSSALFITLSQSCTDYLNKAPDSSITERDVFGNFTSFQGWVEEMYVCICDWHQRCAGNWYHTFNVTDMMQSRPMYWDDGDYWDQKFLYMHGTLELSPDNNVMYKYVWPLAWYAIRKANIGLDKLDLMEGTQEEKNLIKGQCLFFRAFFHFELMQFWGGLPYVDRELSVTEVLSLPRLTYIETARRAAEDFKEAASLLPLSWAETSTAVRENDDGLRIGKIHALSYMGRNLLYAASPMMNEYSTGNNSYDQELCRQAAEALAEVIRLTEQPSSRYQFETWENWPSIFAVVSPNWAIRSGGREVIQNQMVYRVDFVRWTTIRAQSPVQWNANNNYVEVPTHNYVKYYHMANGLPIDDPDSGYDPDKPWEGREPRYYNDIVYHGARMIKNASESAKPEEFAQLDNNGRHRHGSANSGGVAGSVTGYFYRKFLPLGVNPYEGNWDLLNAYQPRMRLADVYLMYAEAVYYGYGSAAVTAPGCSYTPQTAIEKIRERAQLPPLPDTYYSAENFMETLIRERAVELAFEGFRWFDLRRWNLAGELKYRQKTALNFDIDALGNPINVEEVVMTTRVHEKKHNWVPFQPEFTKIHEGFEQNPGW